MREQKHRIELHGPGGFVFEPAVLEGTVPGNVRKAFPVTIRANEAASAGVSIIALDITLDGKRYGEWFDFVANVEP